MVGTGRILVVIYFLFFNGFSSGTYLASDAASAAAKGPQVVQKLTSIRRSQNVEEEKDCHAPAGAPPRISGPPLDVADGLAMPVQPQRQSEWSDTPMVQCMWSTLQRCSMVAGDIKQQEEISEQKVEESRRKSLRGQIQEEEPRIARALWETNRGRSDKFNTLDSNNADSSSSSNRSRTSTKLSQSTGGEIPDAGKGVLPQASNDGQRGWRCSPDGNHRSSGGGSKDASIAAAQADAQGCHPTAKSRTQSCLTEGTGTETGLSVARMGQIHQGEVCRAAEPLPHQERCAGGEVQRAEGKGQRAAGQDEAGSRKYGTRKRGRRRTTCNGDHRISTRGEGRPHRNGNRRRGGSKEGGSPSRRETLGDPTGCLPTKSTKNVVKFNPDLAISIFDEDAAPEAAAFSFTLLEEELSTWESKPWALYGGAYVELAGQPFMSTTMDSDETLRGVGMSSAEDRRTPLGHILFHQHRGRQGDGLFPAVLEGQLPEEDLRQVRLYTFGCQGTYLGRRNRIADRADEVPLSAFIIEEVIDMWHEYDSSSLRLQLVHPQPEDEEEISTLYIIVDFEVIGTAIPILIDRRQYSDNGVARHLSVAYLPHRATWFQIVRGCELHFQCVSRTRNQCLLKIGQRLVIDDSINQLLRSNVVMISYEGDELTPEPLSLLQKQMFPPVRSFMDSGAGSSDHSIPPTTTRKDANSGRQKAFNIFGGGDVPLDETAQVTDYANGECDHDEEDLTLHLFHTQRDHVKARVTPGDPFLQRNEIATAWGIPTEEVVGFHPVTHPPSDLTEDADQTLIIRWRDDTQLRPYPTDVLALFDIYIHGRYLDSSPVQRRAVYWSRSVTTREGVLHFLRSQEVCRQVLNNGCLVSHNNRLWPLQDLAERPVATGDYFRVDIPPEGTGTNFQVYVRLWDTERGTRTRRVFDSTSEDERMSRANSDRSDGTFSDYTSTRESNELSDSVRPQEHRPQDYNTETDILCGPHQISLLDALHPEAKFRPTPHMDTNGTDFILDFHPAVNLMQWMDACIPFPAWDVPPGFEWDAASTEWTQLQWWNYEKPDALHFYTDGSVKDSKGGAGCVLFVRCGEEWYYGGYLAQEAPAKCSHVAELVALLQAYHWGATILHWLSVLNFHYPDFYVHYDSTSAGHKAIGQWGGSKEPTLTRNLRDLCRLLEYRYGVRVQGLHVYGHSGDPGNEAANTIARYATSTTSTGAVSAWATYFSDFDDPALHWLWALWKPEWIGRWQGEQVQLAPPKQLMPDPTILEELVHGISTTPDTAEASTVNVDIQLAVANVLTLSPYKDRRTGLSSYARTEALMQQFSDAGIHFVGVLETRLQRKVGKMSDYYHVIHSPADQGAMEVYSFGFQKSSRWTHKEIAMFERTTSRSSP